MDDKASGSGESRSYRFDELRRIVETSVERTRSPSSPSEIQPLQRGYRVNRPRDYPKALEPCPLPLSLSSLLPERAREAARREKEEEEEEEEEKESS